MGSRRGSLADCGGLREQGGLVVVEVECRERYAAGEVERGGAVPVREAWLYPSASMVFLTNHTLVPYSGELAHRVNENAVDGRDWHREGILFAFWRRNGYEYKAWHHQYYLLRRYLVELLAILFIRNRSLCPLIYPLVPLTILDVHAL